MLINLCYLYPPSACRSRVAKSDSIIALLSQATDKCNVIAGGAAVRSSQTIRELSASMTG